MTEKMYKDSASGEGWWQVGQSAREPLSEIQLFFYDGEFGGSGLDSRGDFMLDGKWLESGRLQIRKHYPPGIPGADMEGEYDGEATMFGTWTSEGERGTWSIRITGPLEV